MEYDENGVPYAPDDKEENKAAMLEAGENREQNINLLNSNIMETSELKQEVVADCMEKVNEDKALPMSNAVTEIEAVENNINTKKEDAMEERNESPELRPLLFIEGNRHKIDDANVIECANRIKANGFIETMPIEFVPLEEVVYNLNGRKLYEAKVVSKKGDKAPALTNFDVKLEEVKYADYKRFIGIIIDGQHRYVALQLLNDASISPSFIPVKIPEGMDILQYIAIRNSGKPWKNEDFVNSQLTTNDEHVDYIMEKSKNKYVLPFLLSIYTLDTGKLTLKQIKAMQGGYKKMSDFKKVVLTQNTQGLGDKICECCEKNPVLSKDRLTGRLGEGLKNFYKNHDSDINKVEKVLEAIDKDKWESYFVAEGGKSMETKAYENAFKEVLNELEKG